MLAEAVASRSKLLGIFLVLTSAILWGLSGTVAQYLFEMKGFTPEWLVTVRLLVSGLILLGISSVKNKSAVFKIWRTKSDRISLMLFSLVGMLSVQYTYFVAIDASNAATATFLQYLAPAMIAVYFTFLNKKLPSGKELLALAFALIGTFLLVTKGSLDSLSISKEALVWGIASAFALAYYTIKPKSLLQKWDSPTIIGWAMLIGGLGISFFHPLWDFEGAWSVESMFFVVFIFLFGTLIPYYCYLESLKYISASETSMVASIEPLSAAVFSVVWLHTTFVPMEWVGALFILGTILLLSNYKK